MGICTRLISWLGRTTPQQPRQAIEFVSAAIASRGDVLVLRSAKPMGREQRIAVRALFDGMGKTAGIKIMLLEPGVEIAQLIKFNDKGDDHAENSDQKSNKQSPLSKIEIN